MKASATIHRDAPNRQYVTLDAAFDFFNRRLFGGKLPPVLITLHRKKGSLGYYSARRFEGRGNDQWTDEIALNPATFKGRDDADILSTLVHEMVHLWQERFGRPPRSRYHNREFAANMQARGLMPSRTGRPGGAKTGQQMDHYIIPNGPFDVACKELLTAGALVQWQSRDDEPEGGSSRKNKTKYSCPDCGLNAWAKPDVQLVCGICETQMEANR